MELKRRKSGEGMRSTAGGAMNNTLAAFLDELAMFGAANDARTSEQGKRMLNITPDTGPFLALLVRATKAKSVLEIGTSNGYSTIWLADAARDAGGQVITVERSAEKLAMARSNFARAECEATISIVHDDAGHLLARSGDGVYEFIFLDSDRARYVEWLPQLNRVLARGGLIVVDNATSHASELEAFVASVKRVEGFSTSLVPLGNGELLIHKAAARK